MRLTHLRELHISSYCLDANLDDLGLNCTALEELHLYSEVDWKSNEYLRMDTLIKDSHSTLNQDPITDSSRVRLTKSLQKLRLISVWGVLTDRIVDLLRLELPALRIDLQHLHYSDMKILPEVISLLAPRLKLLSFYGEILIGELRYLIGSTSNQKQPCIFQCLEQLFVEYFDSEISMGIDALAEQVGCGKFPCLVRLGVTYRNCPNDEVETALVKLARTCLDYYKGRGLDLRVGHDAKWSFSAEFKETIKSLFGSPRELHQILPPQRDGQMFQFATVYYNNPNECHQTFPPRRERKITQFPIVHYKNPGECHQTLPPRRERKISQFPTISIVHYKNLGKCHQTLSPRVERQISQFAIVHYKSPSEGHQTLPPRNETQIFPYKIVFHKSFLGNYYEDTN